MMEADADDSEGGIKYVQFYLGDKLLSTKPNAPYRLSYKLENETGRLRLRVIATDLAGNEQEDAIDIYVTEDGTTPEGSSTLDFDIPMDEPIEQVIQ